MTRPSRTFQIVAVAVPGAFLLLLLLLAIFPWTLAKGPVERALSARFGRPVSIASFHRVDRFGLSPVLAVRGVTIPQPSWAGGGDFVRVAEGRATLPLLPLLIGRVEPHGVTLTGLRLALVRRADGTVNWHAPGGDDGGGGGLSAGVAGLTVRDATILYRDAKRDRQATLRLAIDPAAGLRLVGTGTVRGTPVTLAARGAAVTAMDAWRFDARIEGAALAMHARGTMDRALDTAAMTFDVDARADDLRLVDAVIEAGLFGTQPVRLSAHVRRDAARWRITALAGSIGRSTRIAGEVEATETSDGRHHVTARVEAPTLAFADLSSDEGRAKAAARQAREGEKLVPDLPVDLAKLANTDGRIDFHVGRIVGSGALAAMRGAVTLDHQVLRVDPFTLALTQGRIAGTARVEQGGQPTPAVTLDLTLAGSSIPALAGGHGTVTGTVTAHAHLAGRGATIREAVGRSDGRIGFVARNGVLPARLAAELGFNAGGALFADDEDQAGLRCVIIPIAVRRGHGTLDPAMTVDTTQSRLTGHGTIDFPSEAIAITVTGAPKHNSILRLPGSATIHGSIKQPALTLAPGTKSVGNVLKAIGHAITGDQGPVATDADCGALAAAALR